MLNGAQVEVILYAYLATLSPFMVLILAVGVMDFVKRK